MTEKKILKLPDPSEHTAPALKRRGRGWEISEKRLDVLHARAREMRRPSSEAHKALAARFAKADIGRYKFTRYAVIGSAIVVTILLLLLLVPLAGSVRDFLQDLPETVADLRDADGLSWLGDSGAAENVQSGAEEVSVSVPDAISALLGIAGTFFSVFLAAFTILFICLFLLTDIANLKAEDIDFANRTIAYTRQKTGSLAMIHFGDEIEMVMRRLPSVGPLFPYLRSVRCGDRATEFKQRCEGIGIKGVSLHSYRYAWAERARQCGYPERFAQEALGHNSKAVHRAYARKAKVKLPSLESYERQATDGRIIPLPSHSCRPGHFGQSVG